MGDRQAPCFGVRHIPGVLVLRAPRGHEIPLVLDSPHSGVGFPSDFGTRLSHRALRSCEDSFVPELYAAATAMGAYQLEALFLRTYLDLNRSEADIDPAMLEPGWTGPLNPISPSVARGSGLVWKTIYPNDAIYDRRLGHDEVRWRIETYYRPYHDLLKAMLDDLHGRYGAVWHLNCHSMPTKSAGDKTPEGSRAAGQKRSQVNLANRNGAGDAAEFTEFVRTCFVDLGYETAVNVACNGAYLPSAYSDPADNRHSLQIGLRRDLYMNEARLAPNGGFHGLQADLTRILDKLAEWIRDRSQC